jgi:hypothetical protein
MSFGPVVPSVEELLHHLVSVCVHREGWALVDATEAGVPIAAWPTPEEAPPTGLALNDVVALRPAAGTDTGAFDVVVFLHNGATVDVASYRKEDGTVLPWDIGAHTAAAGASKTTTVAISPLAGGEYGDVVVCDAYGVALVQIVSAGTFGTYHYWGYLTPAARNPDGTGGALGDEPYPYPFGDATLDSSGTASGLVEINHFIEGDVLVTSPVAVSSAALGPTRSGHDKPTVQLYPLRATGDSAGTYLYDHGVLPMAYWATLSSGLSTTMTQVRDPGTESRYLAFGSPVSVAFGPLEPRGTVSYRILTYGGPVVP